MYFDTNADISWSFVYLKNYFGFRQTNTHKHKYMDMGGRLKQQWSISYDVFVIILLFSFLSETWEVIPVWILEDLFQESVDFF